MHLKLSGKIIQANTAETLASPRFLWILTPARKSPFLGFSILVSSILLTRRIISSSFHIRQGESTIFQISTWKTFLLLKIYWLSKIRPISVNSGKRCGSEPAQLSSPTTSHCQVECWLRKWNFFIMNFLNFLRWKSKSWKTIVWHSNDSNKTGMIFALTRDLCYFAFFVAAAEFRLGFGRC